MTYLINLLPVRAQRRRQRLRFWCLVITGTQLVVAAATLSLRINSGHESVQYWQQNEAALLQAVSQRLSGVNVLTADVNVRENARQQQLSRLAENQRWQTRLQQLATHIPDSVWLTQLHYGAGAIVATGTALNAAGLTAFSAQAWPAPGFQRAMPGAVNRNAQGQAVFSLRWPQEVPDAHRD